MTNQYLPLSETRYFSPLMCDYVEGKDSPKDFYHRFPSLDNFKSQIQEKSQSFTSERRQILVQQLKKQYVNCAPSKATMNNIDQLRDSKTFTVTTGHQLNLFTGPLYFLYKIFSTINLAENLAKAYPDYRFVPIYWMATEDHDFEEINYFNFQGKKVKWSRESTGGVGRLSTSGLNAVFESLKKEWGNGANASRLLGWFESAYLRNENLADATRNLANSIFEEYGLVIIDGDDKVFKEFFKPYVEKELFEGCSHKAISETTANLVNTGYSEQVFPREINLFYLKDGIRERIIEKNDIFFVNNTKLAFTKEEIENEVSENPERFSPNALLRPLYQEAILPNLCYLGGGGELAYWFQLKDYFEKVGVPFPMLLLRNSALLVPSKLKLKLEKLEVPISKLFNSKHDLETWFTHKLSEVDIDFSKQKTFLSEQFKSLYDLASKTDASFVGAVAAQEKKQLNGLDHLEKRLLKAQKKKWVEALERLEFIQDALFPNQNLQERVHNFSEWYLEYGDSLFTRLKRELDPLNTDFLILEI